MKWWYFVVGGVVLAAVGFMMRKREVDGAAHAREAKAEKAALKVESDAK